MNNAFKGFAKALAECGKQMKQFGYLIDPPKKEEGFVDILKSLLRSRKVLLAILAVVQTLVAHYLDIPTEVWASVDALLVVLIGAIAYEDAAEKSSGG
jgi:hypothetical protein